jgi:hypothetical protein
MTASTHYRASSLALSLACCLSACCLAGCSSSSSVTTNPAQGDDDSDTGTPSDGGSKEDATLEGDGGQSGDDASSPHDGSSQDVGTAEASTENAVAAGDAGAAQFGSAVCAGLLQCAGGSDAGPCHCTPGSAALERTDFVDTFSSCVQGAIAADCSDAGAAVQNCQVAAAAAINPTAATASFCKSLEFSYCVNTLPDCLTNAGVYSDTAVAAFSNCLADLPDADIDGGCTNFANCLAAASN